jgi:hypothetical protein
MVEILCPHCEEEIELDDDAVGEFSCPYCDGEFEWGEPEEEETDLDFGDFNKVHSGSANLIYKPAMLAFTLVMVIITVVGLNSGSWYGASVTMEGGDLEGEINYDFGLSEADFSSSLSYRQQDTQKSTVINNYEDMEKEMLEYLLLDWNEGEDCEAPWANYDCEEVAEMVEEAQMLADWWGDWDSSGSLLKFFLIMSLIFFIIILISKILLLLDEKGNMKLPANLIEVLNKWDNVSTFVTGILLLIGCVIYAIMMPGEMDGYTFWWSHAAGADVSAGMGMIWWTTLILSIGYFSASIRGLVSDFN